jgi:hypothetical protein
MSSGLLVIGLAISGCAQQPSTLSGEGWVTLLDGAAGLENWDRAGDADWRVVDGLVQAESGKGFLVSKQSYGDFQLRLEFWASHDVNSGVYIRCADPKKVAVTSCYEVNIYDQAPGKGGTTPAFSTGSIVRYAKVAPIYKAGGKWNTYEITAKGPHLTVKLNGVQTVELNNKKYKNGPIALQRSGKGVVKFRKVQIKPL